MQKENTRKIAEGRTAELYILSKSRVLKLFRPGYSQNTVLREYRNHQLVAGKPVRIPKVYECTEVQNRFGYVMENIPGQQAHGLLHQTVQIPQNIRSQRLSKPVSMIIWKSISVQ